MLLVRVVVLWEDGKGEFEIDFRQEILKEYRLMLMLIFYEPYIVNFSLLFCYFQFF